MSAITIDWSGALRLPISANEVEVMSAAGMRRLVLISNPVLRIGVGLSQTQCLQSHRPNPLPARGERELAIAAKPCPQRPCHQFFARARTASLFYCRPSLTPMNTRVLSILLAALVLPAFCCRAGNYTNFDVAIYIPVGVVRSFEDPQKLQDDWDRISRQLKVDKVYIEVQRNRRAGRRRTCWNGSKNSSSTTACAWRAAWRCPTAASAASSSRFATPIRRTGSSSRTRRNWRPGISTK